MIARISSLTAGMAVLLGASGALAQAVAVAEAGSTFATAGTLALSADRMFGFSHTTFKGEEDIPPALGGGTATTTVSTDNISILGRTNIIVADAAGVFAVANPYAVPRIGIDFFPIDGLSVGGSLTYIGSSAEFEQEGQGQSVSRDIGSSSGFLIAPRVGYGVMFNEIIGLWPRGGITFFTTSSEDLDVQGNVDNETSLNGLALTVEVPLILSPADHVGITIGPTLDFPLSGTSENDPAAPGAPTTEDDLKITDFGINAGLVAWF